MVRNDLSKITSLFLTSRVRVKLMQLFFSNPKKMYHMREVARIVDEQINAVRRELMSMEKTEFLFSKKDGIRKYFLINPDFPYYAEFRNIIMKSLPLGQSIYKSKKNLGDIKFAILTHTYLNCEKSDSNNIDLMIIGDPDTVALQECVNEAQDKEKKEIYYTVISEKELDLRKKRRDTLIYSLMVLPTAMLIGNKEEFVL